MSPSFQTSQQVPAKPQVAGVDYLTRRASPSGPKTVLHVGCGAYNPKKLQASYRKADWRELRFDIDASVKPDIVGDMLDMQGVEDASVDAVFSSHNIEHLFAHQVPIALKEFYRVLKPGGHVLITCPDLQAIAALVATGQLEEPAYMSPAGPISALDVIYGYGRSIARGNTFMAHKTGFTKGSLARALTLSGLIDVECILGGTFDLWASGVKPLS